MPPLPHIAPPTTVPTSAQRIRSLHPFPPPPPKMSILPSNASPSCSSSSPLIFRLLDNNFCLFPTRRGPFTFTFPSLSVRVRASLSGSSINSNTQHTQTRDEVGGASLPRLDEPSSPPAESIRQSRRSADWKAARAYHERGMIYQGRVEGFNNGGLLIRFYSLIGFLPFPQLSPTHTCKGPRGRVMEVASGLVGSLVSVKVIQVNEENRLLIFSEKEAAWSKYSVNINAGDVFQGVVGSVEDYGAFIHLKFPDGLYHLTGLVHISEVSWDLVQDVRDVLSKGDEVRVKVLNVDRTKSRITLSIKQLQDDPFFETLDKVISQDGSSVSDSADSSNTSNIEPLPGLETIFNELLNEEGIEGLRIDRQGFEKRVVSQDLQLWLSNAPPMDNKFVLLARAGRQVQEIQLTTSLDQEGIKMALQRVLERVP